MMDRFSTLPSKLVVLIVEETSLELFDISVISRLCRRLRMLVLPYLYRNISWSAFLKDIHPSSCARPIHLLLRSILESPHLGAFVRFFEFGSNIEVHITGPSPNSLWEPEEERFKPNIRKMVKDLLYRSFLPQPARWITALEAGNINAFLSLLATQFPSLQSLDLGLDYLIDGGFLGLIFRHLWLQRFSSAHSFGFSNLHQLRVGFLGSIRAGKLPSRYRGYQTLSSIYLPCTKSLDIVIFCDRYFFWPIQQPPYAFQLVSLDLTCFWSDGTVLKHIVAVMPNLQSLKYNHWLDLSYPPGGSYSEYLDRHELGFALGQLRRTLKHLTLGINGYWPKTYKEVTPYNPQTDLANGHFCLQTFGQLGSLKLPFVMMFGYSPELSKPVGLPEFIRRLTISDDMSRGCRGSYEWTARACLKRLGDCLSDWMRQAPGLEMLELAFGETGDDDDRQYSWTTGEEEEFKALCSEVGLACRIVTIT
ncbi:hypothetical protein MMC31_003118 [Peltigera leucophlebia]|nr:hypothetical protein [Peltigera leucophlebia]